MIELIPCSRSDAGLYQFKPFCLPFDALVNTIAVFLFFLPILKETELQHDRVCLLLFRARQWDAAGIRLRPVVAVHKHEVIRLSPVDPRISRLGQTGVFLANAPDPDALDCTF